VMWQIRWMQETTLILNDVKIRQLAPAETGQCSPSFPASQDTQDRQQQAYTAGYLTVGNNVHETQVALARPVEVAMLHGRMPQVDQDCSERVLQAFQAAIYCTLRPVFPSDLYE